jgi:hypothetical protein
MMVLWKVCHLALLKKSIWRHIMFVFSLWKMTNSSFFCYTNIILRRWGGGTGGWFQIPEMAPLCSCFYPWVGGGGMWAKTFSYSKKIRARGKACLETLIHTIMPLKFTNLLRESVWSVVFGWLSIITLISLLNMHIYYTISQTIQCVFRSSLYGIQSDLVPLITVHSKLITGLSCSSLSLWRDMSEAQKSARLISSPEGLYL